MRDSPRVGPVAGSDANGAAIKGRGQKLLAAGGILAALGASSCCVLPLLLFTLGVSGAWIGNLTALAPYQPVFVAAALAFLAFGFWRTYRRPKVSDCAPDSFCARPTSNRLTKIGLWTATVLVVIAIGFPYLANVILA
ncbi:MAG: mercury transporter MerT [Microbacteriaceae bacterium]|nr:mercury transporter MerT [Microbacteriaceae bacterium]